MYVYPWRLLLDPDEQCILLHFSWVFTVWQTLAIYGTDHKNVDLPCSYLPSTHPKQAQPKQNFCFSENLFFFLNSVNKPFFKIIKSCILIKETITETVILYILTLFAAFIDL